MRRERGRDGTRKSGREGDKKSGIEGERGDRERWKGGEGAGTQSARRGRAIHAMPILNLGIFGGVSRRPAFSAGGQVLVGTLRGRLGRFLSLSEALGGRFETNN